MPPPTDTREEFFQATEDQTLQVGSAAGILGSAIWEGTPSIVGEPDTAGLDGSVEVYEDGSFDFVPGGDFVGQTSFLITVADDAVGIGNVGAAVTQRLHLGAGQHEPGFEGVEQLILVPGCPVPRNTLPIAVCLRFRHG